MSNRIVQAVFINKVQILMPVPVRQLPYFKVHGTDVWKAERLIKDSLRVIPTSCCRYAHSLVPRIISQAIGEELYETGFAAGGDMWFFMLDIPKCRFTTESVIDFCQELSDMIYHECDFTETETRSGEPYKFNLPASLLIKLKTKE